MRSLALVITDTLLVALATILAFAFLQTDHGVPDFTLLQNSYLILSCLTSFILFYQMGTGREIWDFSSQKVYKTIISTLAIALLIALLAAYLFDHLHAVPRGVPVLQFLFAATILIGCREGTQQLARLRRHREFQASSISPKPLASSQSALILGVDGLAGVLIQMLETYASGRIDIVGLASLKAEQVGRSAYGFRILGEASEIEQIMQDLEAHGVELRHVILAAPRARLAPSLQALLLKLEASGRLNILEFRDVMNMMSATEADQLSLLDAPPEVAPAPRIHVSTNDLTAIAGRRYWLFKRGFDIVAALLGLVIAAPLFLLCALLVALDTGLPVFYWQRRPGLGGAPFNVLKFRTMRPLLDAQGRRLADEQRTSRIGWFLRRTRLDELPQLINILRGDMALIGPRPLLPRDQSDAYIARLVVRPGLTGWAQVVGGRVISADDKAALDVWYVYNASVWLDLKILLRTIPVVFRGERINQAEVAVLLNDAHKLAR